MRLEGCRNDGSILLPIGGKFVCPDAAYTTGNLGKMCQTCHTAYRERYDDGSFRAKLGATPAKPGGQN